MAVVFKKGSDATRRTATALKQRLTPAIPTGANPSSRLRVYRGKIQASPNLGTSDELLAAQVCACGPGKLVGGRHEAMMAEISGCRASLHNGSGARKPRLRFAITELWRRDGNGRGHGFPISPGRPSAGPLSPRWRRERKRLETCPTGLRDYFPYLPFVPFFSIRESPLCWLRWACR